MSWRGALRWSIFLAVLGGLVGGGYYVYARTRKKEEPFRTAKVVRVDITEKVTSTGTLQPVVTSPVGSQVSGIIWKIHADYNSVVKEGQILVELDPSLFKNAVASSVAQVAQAAANVASAKAQLAGATSIRDRNTSLGKEGLATATDIDAANASYALAAAQVKSAEANLMQARVQLDRAKLDLEHSVIKSPVNGTVISRSIDVGQAVAASFTAPTLFTIAKDLSKMQVHSNVDEADIGKVKAGQDATFTVDAFRNETFRAKVNAVRNSPQTTQNVVTYDVVLDVENPDGKLRPGMTANVTLIITSKHDVVAVPNEALRFRPADAATPARTARGAGSAAPGGSASAGGGGSGRPHGGGGGNGESRRMSVVYVPDGDQPKRLPIRTGVTDGSFTEVLDDKLELGADVIVDAVREKKPAPTGGFGRGV